MPVHELVQAAVPAYDLGPRTQHQVKRIAEYDLGATCGDLFGRDAFDGSIRADRHESRSPDFAAPKNQMPAAGSTVTCQHFKFRELVLRQGDIDGLSELVKRLHPEGIKNRQARLAGNGASLARGATPRTTASRLARREHPR